MPVTEGLILPTEAIARIGENDVVKAGRRPLEEHVVAPIGCAAVEVADDRGDAALGPWNTEMVAAPSVVHLAGTRRRTQDDGTQVVGVPGNEKQVA